MTVLWMITADEILQISVSHRMLFQCEMDISAKIVHPYLFSLPVGTGGTLVKKDNICFNARLIENTRGQTQDRMQVGSLQQFPAHNFSCPTLEQNIVRYDHRCFASGVENRIDVLDEV